eukprot:3973176-Pyramimonas_sp.AAC.1
MAGAHCLPVGGAVLGSMGDEAEPAQRAGASSDFRFPDMGCDDGEAFAREARTLAASMALSSHNQRRTLRREDGRVPLFAHPQQDLYLQQRSAPQCARALSIARHEPRPLQA